MDVTGTGVEGKGADVVTGTVRDRMSPILLIPEQDDPTQEIAWLVQQGGDLAAAIGASGALRWLVSREGRRSALRIPVTAPLTSIQDAIELLEGLEAGASGVVVVDDGAPVGFLTVQTVMEVLRDDYVLRTRGMGDESLQGETVLPPLVIICESCGARNTLHSYSAGSTLCVDMVSPHPLALSWA